MRLVAVILAGMVFSFATFAFAGSEGTKGGDIERSSHREFFEAFDASKKNVIDAFHRLSVIYNENLYTYGPFNEIPVATTEKQGLIIIPRLYKDGDTQLVRTPELAAILSVENRATVQAVIANAEFKLQETDCVSEPDQNSDGHKDASASRNQEICLNVTSIMRVTPEVLERHLTALIAHEVTHLVQMKLGFSVDETSAQQIQDSLVSMPSVALSNNPRVSELRQAYSDAILYFATTSSRFATLETPGQAVVLNRHCPYGTPVLERHLIAEHGEKIYPGTGGNQLRFTSLFTKTRRLFQQVAVAQSELSAMCRKANEIRTDGSARIDVREFRMQTLILVPILREFEAEMQLLAEEFERSLSPESRPQTH
ncbi:MAG TPA: hypothetical protein VM432_08920 [Bdellovibrionales bacterium]|nr:hypothetical protein [Bdellovibrionales bacterium]